MTNNSDIPGGGEPIDDLSAFEGQFDGSAERVERDYLHDTASGLKNMLRGLLGPGAFPGLDKELTLNNPTFGEDGESVVATLRQVDALLDTRPELAEQVDGATDSIMGARRQQLEADFDRAEVIGDTAELEKLGQTKAELDHEADRTRFWATVIALHSPTKAFILDNLPEYELAAWNGYENRVSTMLSIENDAERFDKEARGYSLDAIDQALATDANDWEDWQVEDVRRDRESALKRDNIRQALRDITLGRARPSTEPVSFGTTYEQPDADSPDAEVPEGLIPARSLEALRDVPGVNPAKAVDAGRLKELPRRGWLIGGKLCPGQTGRITVTRFLDDSFRVVDLYGQTLTYSLLGERGWARFGVTYRLQADKSKVASDPDRHEHDFEEPMQAGGKELVWDYPETLRSRGARLSSTMSLEDPDKKIRQYAEKNIVPNVTLNRMTGDASEAAEIVRRLAVGMGMSDSEVERTAQVFEEGQTFNLTEATPGPKPKEKITVHASHHLSDSYFTTNAERQEHARMRNPLVALEGSNAPFAVVESIDDSDPLASSSSVTWMTFASEKAAQRYISSAGGSYEEQQGVGDDGVYTERKIVENPHYLPNAEG